MLEIYGCKGVKMSANLKSKKIAPEIRLKRYHALLNRISKSPEVDVTPDELISSLKSMSSI